MPRTKTQKASEITELVELIQGSPIVYLTDAAGLTVKQSTTLRNQFRESGVKFRVVKNTLLKRALDEVGGFDELYEYLNGPTAVALSHEPATPARVIKKFTADANIERPEVKAAFVDGAVFGAGSLEVLASLKSRDEIIAGIAALLLAPINSVVGALTGAGSTLVGAVQTIAERGE